MKNLSPRALRLVYGSAQDEGRKSGSAQLLPEHVLIALLKTADGVGYELFRTLHTDALSFQLFLEQRIGLSPAPAPAGELPQSRRLISMLDIAGIEAQALGNDYIGTEHLVLAAVREEGSAAALYFEQAGLSIADFRKAVPETQAKCPSSVTEPEGRSIAKSIFQNLLGGAAVTPDGFPPFGRSPDPARQTPPKARAGQEKQSFLADYSRDLTRLARDGGSDPVFGRDREIRRMIQILSRRTKNNPVLIGEPGVGKTAIVEGLAQRIAAGAVPRGLLKKRILSLDLAALIAGTKYRGEFEERIKRVMKEVNEDRDIILFIDELHTIIGAGGPEGTMDASNMLKPALSRGEIQIIGSSTTKEYGRYIEKDPAFERRFQVVRVDEPSDEETVQILNGIKNQYESFHSVIYEDDVVPAVIRLSRRYIPERFLPDKAIDILDEAGAAKKIQEDAKPAELTEIERQIEQLVEEKKLLVQRQDYENAAHVRDKVISLRRKLEIFNNYWNENGAEERRRVSAGDVCSVIGMMTGIPADQLDSAESRRLVDMEKEIHRSVIGQDEAVRKISCAVRRRLAGISSPKRPIGSFVFLGPTGVGKTQLAKALAAFLFGDESSLIRIDMSDYMEKHNASRLVGAPPGYVGYEDGGVLTEQVRRRPYSVVLLDEIEKAHPDVFNLLLQLLEEGELSDNLGHKVNFRNTVIIMTSNAGARQITNEGRVGFSTGSGVLSYEEIRAGATGELKKLLSPELLNRIDDTIVFSALSRREISQILDIQIAELSARLSEKHLSVTVRPKAREYLVEHGYDPAMGARPMRRLIQREIEDVLASAILSGEGGDRHTAAVDCVSGKLRVRFVKDRQEAAAQIPAPVNNAAVK